MDQNQVDALIDNPLPGEMYDDDPEISKWEKATADARAQFADKAIKEWYRQQREQWLK